MSQLDPNTLPLWEINQKVRAAVITGASFHGPADPARLVVDVGGGFTVPVEVPPSVVHRYQPVAGDLYTVAADGHVAIMPRARFLAGAKPGDENAKKMGEALAKMPAPGATPVAAGVVVPFVAPDQNPGESAADYHKRVDAALAKYNEPATMAAADAEAAAQKAKAAVKAPGPTPAELAADRARFEPDKAAADAAEKERARRATAEQRASEAQRHDHVLETT